MLERCDVRYGSLADITARSRRVRFTPDSGHSADELACPFCARRGHWWRSSLEAGLGHDEVCGAWRGDMFCAPVTEAHEIKSGKKILAGTKDRRGDRDMHFIDEPRLEILPYRCDAATQSDVLTVRRIPSAL